jgi:hypothetical protein
MGVGFGERHVWIEKSATELNRAFSAWLPNDRIPGALPQDDRECCAFSAKTNT